MKILISGAGIAGLTLAYWLKKRGFTPTVVEKHPCLRKGGYKVDVRGAAIEVVKRMGIHQKLLDANVNILHSKFVTSNGKIFEFDGDITGLSSEGEIEVNRWDLSRIISETLDGIEMIFHDAITKIDAEKMVYFEKSSPREFDLVIGADGLRSNVRRLAFGEDSKFLKEYGIHFCIYPIKNIFDLDRTELVYFDKGKLVSAYAVNNNSLAALAYKSEKNRALSCENPKAVFEEQFKDLGWEIPWFLNAMKASDNCYFDSLAQVSMPCWSKGRVALVGDAAYAASGASGMGTSMAIVGAYVLAREIELVKGDYRIAYANYEKSIWEYVEKGQKLAESSNRMMTRKSSSILVKSQLYLMKLMPKKFFHFWAKVGRRRMRKVADSISL
ncbi:MAG: FAD-dependent monooxygenase [Candidatus Algichlamydia australiensis]|nr:FAD-dependent monooxygenase [Chlamydiales bacterium]